MEPLSSPATSPVELGYCFEELLKFTLQSHVNETLEFEVGLPRDFCSNLLQETADSALSPPPNGSSNVNPYPLYKHLAFTLCEILSSSNILHRSREEMASCSEAGDLKQREECYKTVLQNGFQIVNMLRTVNFELHVQEPFFKQLKDGLKTVEGRCAVGDYNRIESGALVLFNKCVMLEVQDIRRYESFEEMLKAETLEKVLPGVETIEEGVQVYRNFYPEEKERSNGVLAICVSKPAGQPYISMANLLSELGDRGIQSLLKLMQVS